MSNTYVNKIIGVSYDICKGKKPLFKMKAFFSKNIENQNYCSVFSCFTFLTSNSEFFLKKKCFLAKDSRLQDQRQNSPAGNKENIKPNETSPSFSKAENKG